MIFRHSKMSSASIRLWGNAERRASTADGGLVVERGNGRPQQGRDGRHRHREKGEPLRQREVSH